MSHNGPGVVNFTIDYYIPPEELIQAPGNYKKQTG